MSRQFRFIDVTLRDAHQCLWATRMTTGMMKDIAPFLDTAGFEAIDLVGGAVFDVCVRFLREDPWERMRILNQWITRTPLIIHTRGQSLFTFEFFPDDIVKLAAERFAANGMRYHTPYDPLNDIRNARGSFASDDDLLLAAFYDDTQFRALKQAGPVNTEYRLAETPLLTLLKEVARRDDIKTFHFFQKP